MTISQIRSVLGDRAATKLLRLMKLDRLPSRHSCPFCSKPMILISTQEPPLELESCRACAVVWFDLPTYESFPQLLTAEATNTIAMQATEIIAKNRLKELKEREEEERKREKEKKQLHRFSRDLEDDNRTR